MTEPHGPAAAGGDQLRAGHADREQVIETLKDAFVQDRLSKDELDARTGLALAARTYAELAALTADIPARPATTPPTHPPVPARRSRPLAKATAGSAVLLALAFALIRFATSFLNPRGLGNPDPYHPYSALCALAAFALAGAAAGIMGNAVKKSQQQRRSGQQLPPQPRPGGHAADGHPGSPATAPG